MAAEQMAWQRDWAVAPGEILLEAIQDRGMSQSDLARRMGRPIKTINEIVNGKAAITPDTAIQLEMTLGIEAAFWDNLESAYRAHLARERVEADLADHVSWAATFPLKDLVKHKLITRGDKKPATVRELFAFFGVGTREAWNSHWGAPAVEYRASPAFEASPLATAAWLRWGELIAGRIETEPFDAKRFRAVLAEIRNMTRRDFPLIHGKVQALCSAPASRSCSRPSSRAPTSAVPRVGSPPTRRSCSSASGTRPTTTSGSPSSTRPDISSPASGLTTLTASRSTSRSARTRTRLIASPATC